MHRFEGKPDFAPLRLAAFVDVALNDMFFKGNIPITARNISTGGMKVTASGLTDLASGQSGCHGRIHVPPAGEASLQPARGVALTDVSKDNVYYHEIIPLAAQEYLHR
jgi:hypothetical protein